MMAAAGEEETSEAVAEAARQLENEVVVGVAASKYFSLALTAKGEVWTFGKYEMMRMHAAIKCQMHCWREGVSAVSCIRSGR
jgi:alpha-tubulin suppressor-like RCC1 family protein